MQGFMHAEGKKIVDKDGCPIILKGWGLGNWLLQEGYMWNAGGFTRFDRPRRIEQVVEELTGKTYAESFWKKYRENYIRQEDIQYMAKLGYNSVRIPFNWRILMEEGEKLIWKEDGFLLLDQCIKWCEEEKVYAFLDLHGAPGGQTGANIDDCVDDVPRLFTDQWAWEKGLALWGELAKRYADCQYVGGYDLLNEPIAPHEEGEVNYDYLAPKLIRFYKEAIQEIRKHDKVHMISLEGMHWATEPGIFTEKLDDNMVLHFHRYAEPPQKKCLDLFLEKAEELQVPLWLGETGENINEWYAALYPLAVSLGIGYNLWTWKKMNCTNSPCSIKMPTDYDKVLEYLKGGPHPGFAKSRKIFDEYLENILFENCELHEEVTAHVFRKGTFELLAVDFDEMPGKGVSYAGRTGTKTYGYPVSDYRKNTGMTIVETEAKHEKYFAFDCLWDNLGLILEEGEFAVYSLEECDKIVLEIRIVPGHRGALVLEAGEQKGKEVEYGKRVEAEIGEIDSAVSVAFSGSKLSRIKICSTGGNICLKRLVIR